MRLAKILFACVLPLVAACSTVTQPDADPASASASFARSLASGPVTFVLGRVEGQTADPIITFDHVCQGARYQHRISDTLMLWPDGRARRAFTTDRLTDGTVQARDHLGFSGTWTVFTEPSWYYYSSGPSIVVVALAGFGAEGKRLPNAHAHRERRLAERPRCPRRFVPRLAERRTRGGVHIHVGAPRASLARSAIAPRVRRVRGAPG